jgi:hypothetical protein
MMYDVCPCITHQSPCPSPQRGDICARDGQENTVLHLAVQSSNDTLCWWLLETAGIGLLHASNNLGFTPVEVAKLGKTPQ